MRLLSLQILVFAAVLTATTASANSILFTLNVGSTGTQSATQTVSLAIDGNTLSPNNGNGWAFSAVPDLTTGWHKIAIDYDSISGTNYLALLVNSQGVPLNDFASYDALGTTINGLTGNYFVGRKLISTIYGEGPIYDGSPGGTSQELYNGVAGLWAGTFSASSSFEEKLTGYIYVGTGTPLLSDVPGAPFGPSGPSGRETPEPDALWLISAAVPLVAFSKLRLRAKQAGR